MTGAILQINISRGGLPKYPVPEAVVTPLGIEGDAVRNTQFHGGPDKALLLVCSEVVDELIEQAFPLFYGALGENLTLKGIDRRQMRPGQRYRAAEVILELTGIRIPCRALDVYDPGLRAAIFDAAVKSGDVSSPRWGMSGFYASVIQPGAIRQSDIISLVDQRA